MHKVSAPVYSIDISEDEQKQATQTRLEFEELLHVMEDAFEHLHILGDSLEGATETPQFAAMSKLFHQYKRKTKKLFNNFIVQLEKALLALHTTVSDAEMNRIRDTIVSEVGEIRDGVITLLDFLDKPEDKDFAKSFKETVDRVFKRAEALEEIIQEQLFEHLDRDVLGKIRLGYWDLDAHELDIIVRGEFYGVC